MDHQVHQGHQEPDDRVDAAAREAVDAGLKVHRALGPGLLESAYEHCLAFELAQRGWRVERQLALPVVYEATKLDVGYRLDLLLDQAVIIEVKSVDAILPIHHAQLLTYLKLSGKRVGILMNFNVMLFRDGVKRFAI